MAQTVSENRSGVHQNDVFYFQLINKEYSQSMCLTIISKEYNQI